MAKNNGDDGIPPEDKALWEWVTREDKPLERKHTRLTPDVTVSDMQENKNESELHQRGRKKDKAVPIEKSPAISPKTYPHLSHGDSSAVDCKTAEKLKRGKFPINTRLDLHGCRQEKALQILRETIMQAHNKGQRVVLVITGKGKRSEDEIGVLKQNVPRWLNLPDIRPYILMFDYAQPKDGGKGALYLLLRRKRHDGNT